MADQISQLLALIGGAKEIRTPAPRRPGFDPRLLDDESLDPSVRVDAANGAMQGELGDRIFQAQRSQNPIQDGIRSPNATSPNEVSALKGLLAGYQDERAASPLAMQQQEYDTQRQGNLTALNQGFTGSGAQNPMQQREAYRRQQEREKLQQPVQLANIRESGENVRQGRQIDATQRMIETQMEPSRMFYENQSRILNGGVDPNQIKSVTRSGTTFQTPARTSTASTSQFSSNLANARNALEGVGVSDPFANLHGSGGEQQYFAQTLQSLVTRSGMHPDSQITFMNMLRDPEFRNASIEDIEATNPDMLQDPDWLKMKQLLVELGWK